MTQLGVSAVAERLALAMEAARLGSWTWDMATGITTWDERLEEMHGLPPGGFGGTYDDWLEALYEDDRAECVARVQAALARPGPYMLLHRTTWADGSVHYVECRGTVLVDDEGRPVGTTGVAFDVTARERREAAVGAALAHNRQLVQTFQDALLPADLPTVDGVRVTARYRAATRNVEVGGDWYAVVPLPDGRLGLAIGDVAGHGIDAVADMAAARFSLRALALTTSEPADVLGRMNRLVDTFGGGTIVTALYGVLDPAARTWTYAIAGHVPVVVRDAGRAYLLDERPGPPLGAVRIEYRTHTATLGEGATLVLYTDGLIERRGEPITAGFERLVDACATGPGDAQTLPDHLLDVMSRGGEPEDDIAIVAVTLTR